MKHPLLADWLTQNRWPTKRAQHNELRLLCRSVWLEVNEQTFLRIHKPCPSLGQLVELRGVRMIVGHHWIWRESKTPQLIIAAEVAELGNPPSEWGPPPALAWFPLWPPLPWWSHRWPQLPDSSDQTKHQSQRSLWSSSQQTSSGQGLTAWPAVPLFLFWPFINTDASRSGAWLAPKQSNAVTPVPTRACSAKEQIEIAQSLFLASNRYHDITASKRSWGMEGLLNDERPGQSILNQAIKEVFNQYLEPSRHKLQINVVPKDERKARTDLMQIKRLNVVRRWRFAWWQSRSR